jgi:uncharacterized protein with FMN-binding domain
LTVRRAVFAILGTAAATSLLVTLKAQAGTSPEPTAAKAPPAAPGQPSAPPASGAPPGGGAPTGVAASGAAAPPAKRTITGRTASTPYGPVTVTITLTGAKITDITAVLPQNGESVPISANAGPKLRQQALAKHSAQLDTVSGASYTSEGYRKSLQSALDQAKRG